jgi:hypothetical protein
MNRIEFTRAEVLAVLNKSGAKAVGWLLMDKAKQSGGKLFKAWENGLDWGIGLAVLGVFEAFQAVKGKVPNVMYGVEWDSKGNVKVCFRKKSGEWVTAG